MHVPAAQSVAPWHILNFLPDPHAHGALRGVFDHSSLTTGICLVGAGAAAASGAMSPDATADWAADANPEDWSSADDCCTFCTSGAGSSLRTTWTCMTYRTKSWATPFISA